MNVHISSPDSPDIEWSVAHLDGVPILCLQASGPTMSAGMACEEIEELQFRFVSKVDALGDLSESSVALFNGHPADGAKVLLETPYDPLIKPVVNASQDGEMWVFCLQYVSQGVPLAKVWYVEGSQPLKEAFLDYWIVRTVA